MSSQTTTLEPELRSALKKLKLGKLIDTLPERLGLATKNKLGYQEMLLLVLHDEIDRREKHGDGATSARGGPRARHDAGALG